MDIRVINKYSHGIIYVYLKTYLVLLVIYRCYKNIYISYINHIWSSDTKRNQTGRKLYGFEPKQLGLYGIWLVSTFSGSLRFKINKYCQIYWSINCGWLTPYPLIHETVMWFYSLCATALENALDGLAYLLARDNLIVEEEWLYDNPAHKLTNILIIRLYINYITIDFDLHFWSNIQLDVRFVRWLWHFVFIVWPDQITIVQKTTPIHNL